MIHVHKNIVEKLFHKRVLASSGQKLYNACLRTYVRTCVKAPSPSQILGGWGRGKLFYSWLMTMGPTPLILIHSAKSCASHLCAIFYCIYA